MTISNEQFETEFKTNNNKWLKMLVNVIKSNIADELFNTIANEIDDNISNNNYLEMLSLTGKVVRHIE